jgi:signal transduction histidine kinase
MPVPFEEESKFLRAEVEKARADVQRLKQVNRNLLTLLAHELRTPLTAIMGYVLLWEERGEVTDAEEVKTVAAQTRLLKRRFDELLTLDQLDVGVMELNLEKVSLAELVGRVLINQRAAMNEKRLRFDSNVDAFRETVVADREKLFLVLDIMLSNACKFSSVGGTITLTAQREDDDCLVTVMDGGVGIPPEDQKRIFDPFFQSDSSFSRRYAGLGLGLTLAKALVEMHGGEIFVISAPGQGSQFTISLPLQNRDAHGPVSLRDESDSAIEKSWQWSDDTL